MIYLQSFVCDLQPNDLVLMSMFFTVSLLFIPAKSMQAQGLSITAGCGGWQQANGHCGGFLTRGSLNLCLSVFKLRSTAPHC